MTPTDFIYFQEGGQGTALGASDPNSDILDEIRLAQDRAEKMLTLSLGLMAFVGTFTPPAVSIVAAVFFLFSFVCFLLTFSRNPSYFLAANSRTEEFMLFQAIHDNAGGDQEKVIATIGPRLKQLQAADVAMREKLRKSHERKSFQMKLGFSGFYGLTTWSFSSLLLVKAFPAFASDPIKVILLAAVFALFSAIIYLGQFRKPQE